jgi:hypothetical protein
MRVITETIEKLIADDIRDHSLVLWFDPERHYETIVTSLRAGQERTLVYAGSFYKLRLEAEPFLRGFDPPKMLVYIPLPWEQAEEPLIEMLSFGVTLRPGVQGNRNTRLAVVARRALKGRLPETRIENLDRQIEQGGLTLAELEQLAEGSGGGPLPTALTVHFGTALVDDAALDFLAHPARDSELTGRNGLPDWLEALRVQYGIVPEGNTSVSALREMLVRQVLTSELQETLGDKTPQALQAVVSAKDPVVRRRTAQLAREWRNRRDLAANYPPAAATVEAALHLDAIDFSDSALEMVQTFLCLERQLLRRIAARMAAEPSVSKIAEERRRGFWAEQDTELQAEWTLVLQAGRLIERAAEIERALKSSTYTASELIDCYTGNANWAELDTLQRRLERRASSLEFALASPPRELEELVHEARRGHQEVAGALAERFLRAWQADSFSTSRRMRQSEIYDRLVGPELAGHRTAYILVDALRWELARELPEVLGTDFEIHMELAIGTAPSITEVGMTALLPSAASGLRLDSSPKLQVSLHGNVIRNRQDRIAYLRERVSASVDVSVIDLKLEDPRGFRRKLKDVGNGPILVVVTSREIDQSGEDEMTTAREHMERVLTHLSLAIRKLAEEGIERFVIATDHGYLFGEDLADSEKIDSPGGNEALCHRRVWVGKGGSASPSYLLTDVSRFGAASELEIAVPWNMSGFRTAGPTAYFHGGLSPQEILLPVFVVTPKAVASTRGAKNLAWEMTLGSAKITTRFLSVRVAARSLSTDHWPGVRIEVRAGNEVCSIPVSGSYGFQESTGAVALRSIEGNPSETEPNTVALMLTGKVPSKGTVSIYLIDVATGVELKRLENVEVSIAI